jgi:hypothetical protein
MISIIGRDEIAKRAPYVAAKTFVGFRDLTLDHLPGSNGGQLFRARHRDLETRNLRQQCDRVGFTSSRRAPE